MSSEINFRNKWVTSDRYDTKLNMGIELTM